jgi:hypothetical protein
VSERVGEPSLILTDNTLCLLLLLYYFFPSGQDAKITTTHATATGRKKRKKEREREREKDRKRERKRERKQEMNCRSPFVLKSRSMNRAVTRRRAAETEDEG